MKLLDVFRLVLRDSLVDEMAAGEVLMHAVVLHTHSIVLRHHVDLEDVAASERSGGQFVLAPLTRSHVAELIAEGWPADPHRGSEGYWLSRYEAETPYELFGDVPNDLRVLALAVKAKIEGHYLVERLIPE